MSEYMILEGEAPSREEIRKALDEARTLRSRMIWEGVHSISQTLSHGMNRIIRSLTPTLFQSS